MGCPDPSVHRSETDATPAKRTAPGCVPILLALLVISAAAYALPPMSAWDADNADGNIAVDAVGVHNGTMSAEVTIGNGEGGSAGFHFDGSGGHIDIPSSNAFDFQSRDFTINFWLDASSNAGNSNLISQDNGTNGWTVGVVDHSMVFILAYDSVTPNAIVTTCMLGFNPLGHTVAVGSAQAGGPGRSVTISCDGGAPTTSAVAPFLMSSVSSITIGGTSQLIDTALGSQAPYTGDIDNMQLFADPVPPGPSCGDTITDDTALTGDMNCSGTGLIIGADSVTLDCNGSTINYSQSTTGYGVNVTGYNFTIIKNCNIMQTVGFSDSYGIYLSTESGGLISNNNITTLGNYAFGTFLDASESNALINNIISTAGSGAHGVLAYGVSSSNTVDNNTITTAGSGANGAYIGVSSLNTFLDNNITTSGYYSPAVYFTSSSSNNFSNNILSTANDSSQGIRIETGSDHNTIDNNSIATIGSDCNGIYAISSLGSTITNNVISTIGDASTGIAAYNFAPSNTITGNTITTAGSNSHGMTVYDNSPSNSLANNTVTVSGTDSIGVAIGSNSNITDNIITSTYSYGAYLESGSDNNFTSNRITSTNNYGVYIISSVNNIFYNNLINGTIPVQTDGSPNYWNATLDCMGVTNIIGGHCIGGNFYANPAGTGFSESPANCTDSNLDGICDSAYDIRGDGTNADRLPLAVFVPAVPDVCGSLDESDAVYTLTRNVSSAGNCFMIAADNVTLDCNGYTLSGDSSGNGIDNSGGYDYTTVRDCIITNFSNGISFDGGASNGAIDNNTVSSNNFGVFLQTGSNNNTLTGNRVVSNINRGIYISSCFNSTVANNNASLDGNVGIELSGSGNSTVIGNTVDSNVYGGASGILLGSSSGNNVSDNTVANTNGNGIRLESNSGHNSIINNTVSGNNDGIVFSGGSDNNAAGNNVSLNNGIGVWFIGSSSNALSDNTVTNNNGICVFLFSSSGNTAHGNTISSTGDQSHGIRLDSSSGNNFTGDSVTNYGAYAKGIWLINSSIDNIFTNETVATQGSAASARSVILQTGSNSNTFSRNTVTCTNSTAVYLNSCTGNRIYNNFLNGTISVDSNVNVWNTTMTAGVNIKDGPWIGGNFYANPAGTGFSESLANCTDSNLDGICDSAYDIRGDGTNADHLPLAVFVPAVPDVCGTLDQPDTVYTMTRNLVSAVTCFTIAADNVTLDCNGHSITGSPSTEYGITANGFNGATVKNCVISKFSMGIFMPASSGDTILNNSINDCNSGIRFTSSPRNNMLTNNTIRNAGAGIRFTGGSNNSAIGNIIVNVSSGIQFDSGSSGGTVSGNTVNDSTNRGFYFAAGSNHIIANNAANNATSGFYISQSSNSTFTNNTAIGGTYGLQGGTYANSVVSDSTFSGNTNGIYLNSGSSNNNLTGNVIGGNTNYGVAFYGSSSGNLLFNNRFNNTLNVQTNGLSELWNATLAAGTNIIGGNWIGGNFYATPAGDGFSENAANCTDADGNRICDSAYDINGDGSNVDGYPLAPYVNSPPVISISSPSNGATLSSWAITVSGTANDTNLDYTRVSIFQGSTLITAGTSTASSFSMTLSVPSDGAYIITATTYDLGSANASASIVVTVSTSVFAPVVRSSYSCAPNWSCAEWSECNFLGSRSRTCTDVNGCGTVAGKPLESQLCGAPAAATCEPNWACTEYGECALNGTQSRSCTDTNRCGTTADMPNQTIRCFYISPQFAPLAGREKNAMSLAQLKIGAADDALDRGDNDAAVALLKEAVDGADEVISTAPTEQNAAITGMLLDAVLNDTALLISRGAGVGASEVILKASDTSRKVVATDSHIASGIVMGIIWQGDSLVADGKVDEGANVLSSAQLTEKSIVSNTLDILDELKLLNIDPAGTLGFDELGVTTSGAFATESKTDEAGRTISDAIASTDPNAKRKGLSDAEKLIKDALSALPEVNKVAVKSVPTRTTADIARSLLSEGMTNDTEAAIMDIESKIAAGGGLNAQKDLTVFRVTNRELTDREINRSMVRITLSAPEQMNNLTIMEYIPKSIAPSASDIVSVGKEMRIVQSDPIVSWTFDFVTWDEMKDVYYMVDGRMDSLDTTTLAAGEPATAPYFGPPEYIEFNFPERTLSIRMGIAIVLIVAFLLLLARGRGDKNLADRIGEKTEGAGAGPIEKIREEIKGSR
ncbi:Periplasmic copper-binding protein (NosD) [uncultured archaeon]|nr:Periplasmic copper-binding protein (NosD) [uncultured archaeon]